jgi:magnesium-transporting ATPase (P-type)
MIIQYKYKTLFKFNYIVALLALAFIIVNYVGYDNCKKNKYDKIYKNAVFTNIIAIVMIFVTLILFAVNKSGEFFRSDKGNYKIIIGNTLVLLFLLVTFTNSANYFNACKKIPKPTIPTTTIASTEGEVSVENDEFTNTNAVIKNGTLTMNIFGLFGVIAMVLFSYNFEE